VTRVVVIGGGVAGLVAARRLALGGATVTLLEASERLGGTVAHHTVGGLVLDAGAESFATRRGTVASLAKELGLSSEIVLPADLPAWLYRPSGGVQLPATSLLGIPGVPLAADVISVVGTGTAFRAYLDALLPGLYGARVKTLGDLVRKRMGTRMLDQLVAPVTLGIHSRHPDELDLDRIAPGLRGALRSEGSLGRAVRSMRQSAVAGAAVMGVRGGIHRIVDELVADLTRLGVTIELGRRGTLLNGRVAGFADAHVVVAAAGVAAPASSITTTLATLVVDAPSLDGAPRGTGALVVPGTPGVHAKAITHATAKWQWLAARAEGKHVLRLSYNAAPPGLAAVARADASALLGIPLAASNVLDFAQVEWSRPAPAAPLVEGITVVGEAVAGTGLAAVIGQAEAAASELLAAWADAEPDVDDADPLV
jgi:protoporphyrinogen/coproporphyrinogen III oxidase